MLKVHDITKVLDTSNWRKITPVQKAEILKREFLGDGFWIKNKQELDLCMSFRKSLKGKPTDEQLYLLEENKYNIKSLRRLLFGVEFQSDKQ
jgi:hypothetical protein